jgi:hypothetical protein
MAYDRRMRQHATGLGRALTGRRLPVFALVLLSASAGAMEKPDGNKGFETGPPTKSIRETPRAAGESKDRIVRDLERKYSAKVLKGPKEREIDGRKVLVFTLLVDKEGRVKEVQVDAETGKEL